MKRLKRSGGPSQHWRSATDEPDRGRNSLSERFEFETWYNLHGPGSIFAECRAMAPHRERADYLGDMADLATPSLQYQVLRDVQFEPDHTKLEHKYPRVPFPWESLEALH